MRTLLQLLSLCCVYLLCTEHGSTSLAGTNKLIFKDEAQVYVVRDGRMP